MGVPLSDVRVGMIGEFLETKVGIAVTSGLAGSLIALAWQIAAQSRRTRRDSSVNAMAVLQMDGDLSRAMNMVADIDAGFLPNGQKDEVVFYASLGALRRGAGKTEWDNDSREKSRALFAVVDYFEAVSVGVRRKIYDKKIIREIACGTFVTMHERTNPFVQKVREEGVRKEEEKEPKCRARDDRGPKSFGGNFERLATEFSEWRIGRCRWPFFNSGSGC